MFCAITVEESCKDKEQKDAGYLERSGGGSDLLLAIAYRKDRKQISFSSGYCIKSRGERDERKMSSNVTVLCAGTLGEANA